eukprot:6214540-Pleurochrysis_carterae.AAC.4
MDPACADLGLHFEFGQKMRVRVEAAKACEYASYSAQSCRAWDDGDVSRRRPSRLATLFV